MAVDGHELTLVVDGETRLARLMAAIGNAQKSLRLFYYIFMDDPMGSDVLCALVAARGRGVEVTLLVDGFGTSAVPDSFFQPLVDAGTNSACLPHDFPLFPDFSIKGPQPVHFLFGPVS